MTEARFQDAVLTILARSGCAEVGINNVAQHAGADKVLIYRYFGDLDGLWQRVAESREWMPDPYDALAALPPAADAFETLRSTANNVCSYAQSDAVVSQLIRWRRAVSNPLIQHFNEEWNGFWQAAMEALSKNGSTETRLRWKTACRTAALLVEAEICGDSIDSHCFQTICSDLQPPFDGSPLVETEPIPTDTLPTNLL